MLATGYNNVDVVAAGRRGIPVSNVPAYSTESVVQTTFALLLELATAVGIHDAAVKAGEWVHCPDHSFWKTSIVELDGLTLGIVGYGTIGRAVARVGAAFGMKVIAYTPRIPQDPGPTPVHFVPLAELFATADVVTLNCPQTADNEGFVNSGLLASMKSTAFLINVARGGLVNEPDLARALAQSPQVFETMRDAALFAATVRAPLTGLALVFEMTGNFELILPLMVSGVAAMITAEAFGAQPVYSELLKRRQAVQNT